MVPDYGVIDGTLLNAIEALLIYAHQPAYNSREKCQPIFSGYNFEYSILIGERH
ncbi:hypothetical protein M942_24220 [Enterobacter ludwigii]|nr:hypothetical protein M942_24220 [Enterobacter ludwigii]